MQIVKKDKSSLIVGYSQKRAIRDEHNRKTGLKRLEKQIKRGKLTQSNINNRGYTKYLNLEGELSVEIDYQKFEADKAWDGLKGYITDTKLPKRQVIDSSGILRKLFVCQRPI